MFVASGADSSTVETRLKETVDLILRWGTEESKDRRAEDAQWLNALKIATDAALFYIYSHQHLSRAVTPQSSITALKVYLGIMEAKDIDTMDTVMDVWYAMQQDREYECALEFAERYTMDLEEVEALGMTLECVDENELGEKKEYAEVEGMDDD